MRIEQLQYLIQIHRSHSIKLASEELFVSHQAVNTAIKQLEDELQTQLIIRTNKGSILTDDGLEIAALAEDFLEKWEAKKKQLLQKNISQTKEYFIYINEYLYDSQFKPLILAFQHKYPEYIVNVSFVAPDEMFNKTPLDTSSIGIFFSDIDTVDAIPDNVATISLYNSELCALINKKNPLAKKDSLSFRDLLPYSIFSYFDDHYGIDIVASLFEQYAPNTKPTILYDCTIDAKERLLESDMAIGMRFVHSKLLKQKHRNISYRYIPIHDLKETQFLCFYNKEQYPVELLEWFKNAF